LLIIYCANPLQRKTPDSAYQAEFSSASTLGIKNLLLNYGALVDEADLSKALRQIPSQPAPTLAIYRGWMLTPEKYSILDKGLSERNVFLINNSVAYRHCHYLPEWYDLAKPYTPKSIWLTIEAGYSIEKIMNALKPFGDNPLILKDFVKSRKHEWAEACYIPLASSRVEVERVVNRFIALQGHDLAGGLVFREFIEFEKLSQHSKSGMPLTKEFRLFFLDNKPIFWTEYWDESNYGGLTPPLDQSLNLAKNIKSRFFSMDIAKRINGNWIIVEIGDGQVSGLPHNTDSAFFYRALLANWPLN